MRIIAKSIYAFSVLFGAIVGVGIFSLPYIAQQVGFWVMLGYLIVLTFVVLSINLIFSHIAIRTPNFLRLPAFAKKYLGRPGQYFATFSAVVGTIGTLLIYIVVGGSFLANLLSPYLGGSPFIYAFVYFAIGAVYIYFGSRAVSRAGFWISIIFFLSLATLLFKGLSSFKTGNMAFLPSSISNLFLPYGPILFALWGATMIPEAEELVDSDEKKLRKVIIAATIISAVCYLAFFAIVCGISGQGTSVDAITGLKGVLGAKIINILFLVGVLSTFSCFIMLGLNLKKVLWYDIKIPHNAAWGLTCFIPFLMYLLGFNDFIKIIGFVGGFSLAIEGILILLMYRKTQHKKNILIYPLLTVFVLGIIYSIVYFAK